MGSIFADLSTATIVTRLVIVLIVAGFIPLSAISFFKFMMQNKRQNYEKALREMGIQSSRSVRDTFSPSKFLLPVSFASLICLFSIFYYMFSDVLLKGLNDSLLLSGGYFGEGNQEVLMQGLSTMQYAFLGGFIWSAYTIIRRIGSYDLMPNLYYNTGIRIIMASLVALVISFLLGEDTSLGFVNLKNWLPGLAFLIGMFPDRGLNYLIRRYEGVLEKPTVTREHLSLNVVEGISVFHKERLQEIGIDNAQNLAAASLTRLLIETPFEARLLLDWIGQSKLICYTKEHIGAFRGIGIRSVFDFFKGQKSLDQLRQAAESAGIPTAMMDNVFRQCVDDRGVRALFQFQQGVNQPDEPGGALPLDVKNQQGS